MSEIMYVIYKMGVYGHGVFGLFSDFDAAKEQCIIAASNDKDDYHDYELYDIEQNSLFCGDYEDNGFMEKKPIFSCKKL